MLVQRNQDFLMRQIHAFAAGILRALGAQLQSEEEGELDLLEKEVESRLGFPFGVVADMELSALVAFLSVDGEPDPDRMLLCGFVFAGRSAKATNQQHRVRALALIARAIDAKPGLLDDQVAAVLRTLSEGATPAMNVSADR